MAKALRKAQARLERRKASAPNPNGKGQPFREPGSMKKKGK